MGEVKNAGRLEVGRGDVELRGRSRELNGIGSGDVGWWEVGLGDGKYSGGVLSLVVLEGRPRGTMKQGEQSQCLLPVKWGWGEWENIFHKLDMTRHKDFF